MPDYVSEGKIALLSEWTGQGVGLSPFSQYIGEKPVPLMHITALISGNPERCSAVSGVKGWQLVKNRQLQFGVSHAFMMPLGLRKPLLRALNLLNARLLVGLGDLVFYCFLVVYWLLLFHSDLVAFPPSVSFKLH